MDVSEAARLMAAKRQIVEGNCQVCGREFTGTKKRKYCSHTCGQRAYQEKKNRQMEARRNEGK